METEHNFRDTLYVRCYATTAQKSVVHYYTQYTETVHYGRNFEICPKIIRSFSFNNPIKVILWLELVKTQFIDKTFYELKSDLCKIQKGKNASQFLDKIQNFLPQCCGGVSYPPRKLLKKKRKKGRALVHTSVQCTMQQMVSQASTGLW